ncbi:hypothetical protein LTR08_000401 [Meristemomyces frigidus]|nr:hypothetical protein LTR08_000401 [Meristemomyces frigidus]
MHQPVDASVATANPRFDALYRDLCANKLNADGTSKLDAKALKERQTLEEDLHQARLETAKREIIRNGLCDLVCRSDDLPDELRDLVSITAVALDGNTANEDEALVDEELETLNEHAPAITRALSKQLEQDVTTLALLLAPNDPHSVAKLAAGIQVLQTTIATSRTRLADTRYSLAQDIWTLHDLYRQVMQTSIRALEQTIHGSVARGTKAKAEYLAVVAEGISKKLSVQHGQLMMQLYSPEAQERLRARMEGAESETRVVRRKIREAEEQLGKFRQARGMEAMVKEYAEILMETKKVKDEVERLQKNVTVGLLLGLLLAMEMDQLKKAIAQIASKVDSDSVHHNFTLAWRQDLEIVEAKKLTENTARAVYRFPVKQEFLNPAGGLHGGAAATFHDIGTSMLLSMVARPGFWATSGTTRTLNMTYLRPAMKGEMLLLECVIVHAGKSLCLLKGTLMRERDGAIISTCEHNKFDNGPKL